VRKQVVVGRLRSRGMCDQTQIVMYVFDIFPCVPIELKQCGLTDGSLDALSEGDIASMDIVADHPKYIGAIIV
jgi:hypothetical protein